MSQKEHVHMGEYVDRLTNIFKDTIDSMVFNDDTSLEGNLITKYNTFRTLGTQAIVDGNLSRDLAESYLTQFQDCCNIIINEIESISVALAQKRLFNIYYEQAKEMTDAKMITELYKPLATHLYLVLGASKQKNGFVSKEQITHWENTLKKALGNAKSI